MTEQSIVSQDMTLKRLFQDFYRVPDYQREYVWGEADAKGEGGDQVDQFLSDIHIEFEAATKHFAPEYFIGTIVVCKGDDQVFELIDGQQRTTTAYLTLCAIRDALADIGAAVPEELGMRVSRSLVFTANLGIIDARYDTILFDISGDGRLDQADLALSIPRVPPVTVGAGLLHELELKRGSIVTRVNYQYRDRASFTDDNFGWLNDVSMLEANITWNTPVEGLSLSLYGRNLLDQVREGGDTQVPFGGPRSNGVQQPFQQIPGAGTFSPLLRGRDIGLEVMFAF